MTTSCSGSPPARPSRERLPIGVIGDFSSESSPIAQGAIRGVELAVEEYNADPHSSYEIEIVRHDTGGGAQGAAGGAAALAQNELLIGVVGPFRAEEARIVGPVFAEPQVSFFLPSVTDSSLSEMGWSSFRRLVADDRREGEALAFHALETDAGRNFALLHDGGPAGVSFSEGAKIVLAAGGAQVLRAEAAPARAADQGALGAALVQAGATTILFGGAPDRASAMLVALRQSGFQGRVAGSHEVREQAFIEAAGGAGEGVLASCVCVDPMARRLGAFTAAHRAKFEEPPSPFAAETYEGALMLLEALEEVAPRAETITRFLSQARVFRGDTKRYEFDPTGELIRPSVWIYELRDGVWKPVGPSRPNPGR